MKKILLTLITIITIPLMVNSQKWIQKGSTWHYDYWNIGTVGFYKLNYDKDTIIGGQNCQKITDSVYVFYYAPNQPVLFGGKVKLTTEYTYNNGDSVFYLHDSTFYLLYNFGAHIGDSWIISNDTSGGCLQSVITVTDTGHININNEYLRWIYVESNIGGKYFMKGKVIESIGFIESNSLSINSTLFPREVACDSNVAIEYDMLNFKCFSDSNGVIYNPSGEDCEYYLTHLAINKTESKKIAINIFPNPAKDVLNVNFSNSFTNNVNINIYSLSGLLIKTIEIPAGITSKSIDIHQFSSGMYFYNISANSNILNSGKFIIVE
jgi:hypothetical protein